MSTGGRERDRYAWVAGDGEEGNERLERLGCVAHAGYEDDDRFGGRHYEGRESCQLCVR